MNVTNYGIPRSEAFSIPSSHGCWIWYIILCVARSSPLLWGFSQASPGSMLLGPNSLFEIFIYLITYFWAWSPQSIIYVNYGGKKYLCVEDICRLHVNILLYTVNILLYTKYLPLLIFIIHGVRLLRDYRFDSQHLSNWFLF
jgi:hypothetical protein